MFPIFFQIFYYFSMAESVYEGSLGNLFERKFFRIKGNSKIFPVYFFYFFVFSMLNYVTFAYPTPILIVNNHPDMITW
jgi:hypothetical protein